MYMFYLVYITYIAYRTQSFVKIIGILKLSNWWMHWSAWKVTNWTSKNTMCAESRFFAHKGCDSDLAKAVPAGR